MPFAVTVIFAKEPSKTVESGDGELRLKKLLSWIAFQRCWTFVGLTVNVLSARTLSIPPVLYRV